MVLQDYFSRSLKRILMQVVKQELDTNLSTTDPTGSWYKWSKKWSYGILKRILDPDASGPKGFSYRDLAQVIRQDPDASGPKGSSYRDLAQVICRDLAEVVLHDPGSWYERTKRSWYRDLAQVVLQHPDRNGRKGSWNRDLAQVVLQDPDRSGPQGSWYRWSWDRGLAQVVLQILMQVVQKDPHTEILRQGFCTSATTGSWYKWPDPVMSCGFTFASCRCTLTHTVWGLLPG